MRAYGIREGSKIKPTNYYSEIYPVLLDDTIRSGNEREISIITCKTEHPVLLHLTELSLINNIR